MENLGHEDTAQKMIGVAKKCLGIWQKLVHITGGELELTKSCFSLMTWKLNNGTEELSSIKDEPGTLNLRSGKYTGLEVDLRCNSVQETERLLGVRLALDGGDDAEYSYRLDQAKALAGKLITSPFTRYDAEVIYRERWIASVGYCLPITQFTEAQCDKI